MNASPTTHIYPPPINVMVLNMNTGNPGRAVAVNSTATAVPLVTGDDANHPKKIIIDRKSQVAMRLCDDKIIRPKRHRAFRAFSPRVVVSETLDVSEFISKGRE